MLVLPWQERFEIGTIRSYIGSHDVCSHKMSGAVKKAKKNVEHSWNQFKRGMVLMLW